MDEECWVEFDNVDPNSVYDALIWVSCPCGHGVPLSRVPGLDSKRCRGCNTRYRLDIKVSVAVLLE